MIRLITRINKCHIQLFSNSPITFDMKEESKRKAAYQAVDDYVKDGMKLGIGSGSTIVYAVERIVQRIAKENLNLICVPTSYQARQLIVENKLKLESLDNYPILDCSIDGADEVDIKLNLIKGGGGCQTQEKLIASCSKTLVIVADYTKNSKRLGDQYKKGIPIEVIPMAHVPIANRIKASFGGNCVLRMAKMKMGPVVTDNGNFIIDWNFPEDEFNWESINSKLTMMPGVVETGLFVNMASIVYFGQPDGTVKIVRSKSS